MDEPPEPEAPEGMGPAPTGPSFAPWQQAAHDNASLNPGHPFTREQQPVGSAAFAPSKSRLPAVVTAGAVLLVSTIVFGATWVAGRNDALVAAPTVRAPVRTAVPLREDSIAISTAAGSGRLIIVGHRWTAAGREAPRTGTTLQVEVELVCTSGELNFDPYFFQAFDQSGRLFEVLAPLASNSLDTGTLGPDEKTSGTISFDMPRGQVTLLMTDESTQSVTALKIPD